MHEVGVRIIHRNINTHFFSTDLSCKRGVRIIHRCGLYTGKDGIYVFVCEGVGAQQCDGDILGGGGALENSKDNLIY